MAELQNALRTLTVSVVICVYTEHRWGDLVDAAAAAAPALPS